MTAQSGWYGSGQQTPGVGGLNAISLIGQAAIRQAMALFAWRMNAAAGGNHQDLVR